MKFLKILPLLTLAIGAYAQAYTLKCGAFGNDANARPFTLSVAATQLTITLDASGETSTASKMKKTVPVTKYTNFSKAIGSEVYGFQTVNLITANKAIGIPDNLNTNPIQVRLYDPGNQGAWSTANCSMAP
jgi:hypothetical protein